jgi:hypothetical protein
MALQQGQLASAQATLTTAHAEAQALLATLLPLFNRMIALDRQRGDLSYAVVQHQKRLEETLLFALECQVQMAEMQLRNAKETLHQFRLNLERIPWAVQDERAAQQDQEVAKCRAHLSECQAQLQQGLRQQQDMPQLARMLRDSPVLAETTQEAQRLLIVLLDKLEAVRSHSPSAEVQALLREFDREVVRNVQMLNGFVF